MLAKGAFENFYENPTSLLANGTVGTLPDHKTV
jgi:hypothetical protein